MKYEDLVKMSVKELKDRLKDLNTQAQAAQWPTGPEVQAST